MRKLVGVFLALVVTLGLVPAANAMTLNPAGVPARTSLAVVYSDGRVAASPNGHESRPALSLAKLYLATGFCTTVPQAQGPGGAHAARL
ncbi:hypothetical protein [Corynebacterium pilosum]|uniref:hypothetical protein n=1 Tax=Corynebacterium pilosum TaxID=35756 RepID=UPI000A6835C1|nr:hypothetical protein [Corynebacterium pilosum]